MRHPHGDAGDVSVDVGAGVDVDSFGQVKCHSTCLPGQGFHHKLCRAFLDSEIEIKQSGHPRGSIKQPNNDNRYDPGPLRQLVNVQMRTNSNHSQEGNELM